MKKTLSFILAILMIVTSVPFAFAESEERYFYKISHQPTVDEFYVDTSGPSPEEYQWYEIENGKVIDDTVATPADGDAYGVGDAYYADYSGKWVPAYIDEQAMLFFNIPMKKGESIRVECSADAIYTYFMDSDRGGMQCAGGKAIFTAEKEDVYTVAVVAEYYVQATARFVTLTALEGETSTQLNNYEPGKTYVCCATYDYDVHLFSDEVYVHQHTGTELTCMGYKCTVCGKPFGEEKGEHSFTSYVVTTAPTTEKPGIEKAECDYGCGETDIKRIPALPSKAEIDVVYDEYGDRVGIKSITIESERAYYYDIFEGKGDAVEDFSAGEFYKKVLTTKPISGLAYNAPLRYWGEVAANVFKTAGRGYGWQWDYGSDFNTYFGSDAEDDSNAAVDVSLRLGSESPFSKGKSENDCVRSTGLQSYSSLSMVQDVMLDQIIECCGEGDDAEEFREVVLDFCIGDKEGFELFKNDDNQVVLANIVTSQYNYLLSTERLFSTFGIVFYDFELSPIIDENLQYISAADNYDSIKDAFEANAPGVTYTDDSDGISTITYIQNPTSTSASVSASSDRSVTNSVSNSFSDSFSHSYTESVSVNAGIKISDALKVGLNIGFSASQALSTAYSESTSLSETISTSSSASVTLPPYTELGIKQTMSKSEQSVEYDCPVYITYKVAVFGVNAQYIQDTGTGSWSITNYDQGSIFTNFGSDLKEGGLNAVDNLANRVKEKSKSFELSYGNTYGQWEDQNDGNPPKKITYLDWSKLDDTEDLDYCSNLLSVFRPMSAMGGKMTFKTDSYNTELTEIYPIYDLEKVRFEGDGTYNLAIGGSLDLNTVNVVGLNKFDHPYYGFRGTMGSWQLCDEDGNDLPAYEEGKGISVTATPSSQVIEAHELGEYYLRFDIDENYYKKAVDRKTFITNDDLEMTAIMKLSVTDTGNNHTCRPGGWITYIPANCVVEGERYRNCLTCSKRMATEVIPKADHIPIEVVTPATCITDGSKTTTCLTCKAIISNEVIPAKGHGNTYAVTTVVSTCTCDGEKALYCYDCNNLVGSEVIAATGHDNGVWKIDFEATPEHEGQMTKYCSICNAALESKTFAYHTHSFTAWGKNNDGTHARSCYLCSFTETANCNYDETAVPATCLTDGHTVYTCSDCGYKYSEINEYAPGHTWGEWTDAEDGNHQATCSVCQTKEKTVHIFVDYIPNNDATKDSDGTKTATCAVCTAKDTVIDEGSRLEEDAEQNDCSHICHKTGIMGFIWKILRLFWSIFKMNPVCECGAAHY